MGLRRGRGRGREGEREREGERDKRLHSPLPEARTVGAGEGGDLRKALCLRERRAQLLIALGEVLLELREVTSRRIERHTG